MPRAARAEQGQAGHAFRVQGGDPQGDPAAVGGADERGALDAEPVQQRDDVAVVAVRGPRGGESPQVREVGPDHAEPGLGQASVRGVPHAPVATPRSASRTTAGPSRARPRQKK